MTTLSTTVLAIALLSGPASSRLQAAPGELANAKALYASAAYEEALQQLSAITDDDDADQVDQYRALCLLALGRTREAEQPLEQIVVRRPLYVITEGDASPKLVDLFREVRRRALPGAARELYAKARASFDGKQYSDAATQFKQLIAVLDDKDASDLDRSIADLKPLGEGFLKLAEAAVAPAAPAAAPTAAAVGTTTGAVPPELKTATIYSVADSDVIPPVDIDRRLPRWVPRTDAARRGSFSGTLSVVINEQGAVESATLLEPVTPAYDGDLIATAKRWKFRPATKGGVPVKFQKSFGIALQPTGE